LPRPEGCGQEYLIFRPEKARFYKPTQLPRHQDTRQPGRRLKKRTDSKKGPFFGRFGRKTGVLRMGKTILFCVFARFRGLSRLQAVVHQELPAN
jgi:hypothetical protein